MLQVSPVFIGLVGITAASGVALWFGILPNFTGALTILFVTAGWITSVCVHEFGHAFVAYLGGIGLPGGAVYIDRGALRSRAWDSAVSVAGPVGTLLCGLIVAGPFMVPGSAGWLNVTNAGFFGALAFLGFIEAIALVLNLLPVPGLDGYGIIRPWLPYSLQGLANQYGQLGILAVFGVLWFVAPVSHAFFQSVLQITNLAGIPQILIGFGQSNFRFR